MGNHSSILDTDPRHDVQFLLVYYNDRRKLSLLPQTHEELEQACRKLFSIPEGEELRLSFELDRIVGEHMEIDPLIWGHVRSAITGAWVDTPYYQPDCGRKGTATVSSARSTSD